jgi:hypothetical protein
MERWSAGVMERWASGLAADFFVSVEGADLEIKTTREKGRQFGGGTHRNEAVGGKFEIRNPKSEIRNKSEIQIGNPSQPVLRFLCFLLSVF